MVIDYHEFRKKVFSCFMGKSVGGTLGIPFEGDTKVNPIFYYDPVPDKMLPNDDLDLQVVNLGVILRTGLPICRYHLGEIWKHHIEDSTPDEYGVALSNYRTGVFAPLSGQYRNKFYGGMGSAIRSELWACLAPANPELAAKFAKEDACTDHTLDGIYAEMFLSAVESAAFIETDIFRLVEIGLAYVQSDSRLYNAIKDVLSWWDETKDVLEVRSCILNTYGVDNWTDVTINLSFIILSLISCGGSFDNAICTAVSLGYDTDCTGATVGSIMGIINPNAIDKRWTDPIGSELVLSPCIINMHQPDSIEEFCDSIISVAKDVQKYYGTDISFANLPCMDQKAKLSAPWIGEYDALYKWEIESRESLVAVTPFMINLVYQDSICAVPGQSNQYKIKLVNTSGINNNGYVQLSAPDKWKITPQKMIINLEKGKTCEFPFEIFIKEQKHRHKKNIVTMTFNINELSFSTEAGIPIAYPWVVTDLATGKKSVAETCGQYFYVPEGSYSYKVKIKSTAKKQARISASGTRPFKVLLNDIEVFSQSGSYYVPTFHRDNSWTTVNLNNGYNDVEIIFENSNAGEFFFGFGTIYACATWIDSIERSITDLI